MELGKGSLYRVPLPNRGLIGAKLGYKMFVQLLEVQILACSAFETNNAAKTSHMSQVMLILIDHGLVLLNVVGGSLFSEPCRTRIAPLGRDQYSLQAINIIHEMACYYFIMNFINTYLINSSTAFSEPML